MANYVDGFVLPVPKKKLAAYRRMAREAGKVMRELGALAYVEAVADDVKPGKWTSFPQSVKLKSGEVVVFSYIVYKSRRARDRIMPKFMKCRSTRTRRRCPSTASACSGAGSSRSCGCRRRVGPTRHGERRRTQRTARPP